MSESFERGSFDLQLQAASRAAHRDPEAAAALLRARLRSGELCPRALGLRALAGEPSAQLALGAAPPASELAAWVEALGEVDPRARVCAPLVAAGLCLELLAGWPAGEGTARVVGQALIEVALTSLDLRDSPGAGGLDPRRAAEQALEVAAEDLDELRQLMESIQAEHGLVVLREPRALASGLAAVEAIRAALRARRGLKTSLGLAVAECADALGERERVRAALEASLLAAAARLERQAAREANAPNYAPRSVDGT